MDKGLTLTSNFESGNLHKAVQIEAVNNFQSERLVNIVTKEETYYSFELWLTPDS